MCLAHCSSRHWCYTDQEGIKRHKVLEDISEEMINSVWKLSRKVSCIHICSFLEQLYSTLVFKKGISILVNNGAVVPFWVSLFPDCPESYFLELLTSESGKIVCIEGGFGNSFLITE